MWVMTLKTSALLILALGFSLLASCSAKVNNLTTDDGTFNEGLRLMEDGFDEEARKQFARIKTEFPNSSLQATADLKVAESYYNEESYQTAAEAYQDFVRFYPSHEKVPYALYQAGLSYSAQMPSNPQRDSRATKKAIDVFTQLIIDFPESEYRQEAEKKVIEAQDQIVQKNFEIASFYERQNKPLAAYKRFYQVYELYPRHAVAEEAFARSIYNLRKTNQAENLDRLIQSFEVQFPNSKFRKMIEP